MALLVIDLLEVVDIEIDDGGWLATDEGLAQGGAECLHKAPPVREPGELVAASDLFEPTGPLGVAPLDVAHIVFRASPGRVDFVHQASEIGVENER